MFKAINRPGPACLMAFTGRKTIISTLTRQTKTSAAGTANLRSHSHQSQSLKTCLGFVSLGRLSTNLVHLPQNVSRRLYSPIVEEGISTHKPTPFQQRILVWGHFYPSLDKVPERVSRAQMKKAMDKFRVKVSIYMAAMTAICAAVMAFIGRRERQQGKSVTKMNLDKHAKDSSESDV
ncbi:unnamed protein product [Lymnaea stagnalis]|uniref:Uncharacterized protein n=1 Tax=Lymnaea stagnalis TaxID=6523 RepID=A0AAV2I0D8_LYMST